MKAKGVFCLLVVLCVVLVSGVVVYNQRGGQDDAHNEIESGSTNDQNEGGTNTTDVRYVSADLCVDTYYDHYNIFGALPTVGGYAYYESVEGDAAPPGTTIVVPTGNIGGSVILTGTPTTPGEYTATYHIRSGSYDGSYECRLDMVVTLNIN